MELGSPLYRCFARIGYKFFNSSYMVVFDEKMISNISMNLQWEPNFSNMNSEVENYDLMSYATNSNNCNVTIIDPFFTGIAFPSLIDTAYQVIGNDRGGYSSMGMLLPPCEDGQVPGKNKCWNYEIFDPAAIAFGTEELKNLLGSDVNMYLPPMLFISLWYETPQGYTFGTDFLFRVSNASVVHGSEFPSVTISGTGNYGVVFQNKLNNMAIDKNIPIEEALEEIAKRNGFNLNFCVADYSEENTLKRKAIKANVTTRDFLNEIVRSQEGGNMLSPPTKEFFNTLHVCTRGDTYQGCNVFYLGKPLYEGYKLNANVDPSWVSKNYFFGDAFSRVPGKRSNVSQYSPEINFLEEDSWELIVPPQDAKNKSINDFESIKVSEDNIEIKYKSSDKIWKGEWKNFLDKRDKYFTQINKNFVYFDTDGNRVNKKSALEANPGRIGRWQDGDTIAIFDGKISHIEKVENSTVLKSLTIKTNRIIALRNKENEPVILDIYIQISNVNINPDVVQNLEVKLGQLLGTADNQNLQTLTFYTSVADGEKVYLETELALKYSLNRGEVLQLDSSKVPSQASSLPTGGDLTQTEKIIAEYFASQGITRAGIASILGTMKKESSFDPQICDGDFCGLIQWSSARRKSPLWQKSTNDNKADILIQCRFLILEAKQKYKKTYDVLKNSDDLEKVMKVFTEDYVRPSAENRRSDSPRFIYAREYFQKIKINPSSQFIPEPEEYVTGGHDQAQKIGECTSGASTCYGHRKYNIYSGYLIKIGDDTNNGEIKLHPDAANKFKEMQNAARAAGHNMLAISGYRNLSTQQSIWNNRKNNESDAKRAELAAPPGYSEHHTGYTVDIWEGVNRLNQNFKNSDLYKWMTENAKDYGFELSFPQGNSQGISFEPWHWRFIGTDEAKAVFANTGTNTPTAIQPTPAITKVGFVWPTTGRVGDQTGASGWSNRGSHGGIDIAAPLGAEVVASAPGKVYAVETRCTTNPIKNDPCRNNNPGYRWGGLGNVVVIDHEGGYRTIYAHLKNGGIFVKEGDIVSQCQKIGEVGNSGGSRGFHLHFEIRKNGNKIEPGTKNLRGTTVSQCSTNGIIQPNSQFPNVPGSNSGNINTNQPGGQSAVAGQSQPGRSGFTIETSFKGVPRALRILPKFTILALVSKYSEWFKKGFPDDDSIDPGIWIPDYFRNWLTTSVTYNWTSGDLKCTVNAMSAFGMDNSDLVPSWEEYVQNDIKPRGALSSYKDYIRGFGDLCWTTKEDGVPSCHKRCGLTEDFVALLSSPTDSNGAAGISSSSSAGCKLDNGKINLSDEDLMALRKISLAEAKGEGKIGMALVARAIFNRKLIIDAGRPNYCSNGNSIKAIIEARCSSKSRYQFSPLDSDIGGTYNKQSSSDFPLADEAIKLAFDYDALKAANISDYILTSNNFRNVATSSRSRGENWIDNGQSYENHTFARDNVQNGVYSISEHLAAFDTKYGKCERDNNQTPVSNNAAILNCIKISDVEVLAKKISQAESASGGYDAVNIIDQGASTLNATLGKSYSQLTVQEIKEAQEAKKIGAVGRYQVIRDTMDKAIQGASISLSDKFDKTTQDKIFIWLITIKRPEIGNYLIGANNDLKEAAQSVAREWAGIGLSYPEAPEAQLRASGVTIEPQHKTKRPTDSSLYAGVNGNKASVSSASIQESLKAAKANIGDKCKDVNTTTSNNKNSDIENKLREILNKNSLQSIIVKTKKGIKYEIINSNKPSTVSIASMGKLPITTLLPLMESKIRSESGLNEEILIDPKLIYEERGGSKEQPSSFAQRTTNGKYYSTIKFLIDKMLRDSNNTATNVLIKEILGGPSAATNEAKRLYGNNIQIGYYGPVTRDRMGSNTTVKAETPYIFAAWEKIKSGSGVFYNVVRSALSASNRYKLQGDISSMSKIGITSSILGNVGSYTNGEILVFEFGDNKSYNTSNNQRKLAEIIKEINILLANQ